MFPRYSKEFDATDVFGKNGYDNVPAYRKEEVVDSMDYTHIAAVIRTKGSDSCGFIDNNVINYHTCDAETYFINMDNEFVFAYFMGEPYNNFMPVMMILEFLKYSAKKIMLIYEDTFFILEKSKETYAACEKLDELYFSESFLHNIFIKAIGDENYEMIFHKLIEIFSMRYLNKDARKYNNLDVLMKILKLNIE